MTVKFCKNCFTPNTRPRIAFNNQDICNACLNAKDKKKINWKQREIEFYKIISNIKKYSKKNKRVYDCIVPWSGGKDSSSIALKLKYNFGLNPLLVTFSPLIINEIGVHNREELLKKGFDSIFFRPNQDVARILAKRFFIERGNPKVAWDAGINSVPVQVAIAYKVPYIFYAEHGESEYGGLVLSEKSKKLRDVRFGRHLARFDAILL
jgi:tRNA(Ile)-lysidine synthase TilS/MesJ